jgi:hypothetical protein
MRAIHVVPGPIFIRDIITFARFERRWVWLSNGKAGAPSPTRAAKGSLAELKAQVVGLHEKCAWKDAS